MRTQQAKEPLSAERWRRIDELLEAAMERPPEDRRSFLAAACGDDTALHREVEELLAADRRAVDFLETPAPEAAGLVPEAGGAPGTAVELGTALGPYRLERAIGAGGMGTVYQAVRDDGVYRRRVAIKLLNPGRGSVGLARRFRGERQILASLDHPYIARLFDGGEAADGRPYLVMEYVDGEPIDDYCDRHRLTVRQRLELFRKVCSAVHYAHQNLVVHRDIKPTNILVTADGEPRLLDFGIAKLLDPEAFPVTVEATVAGLQPMTPHYASPEQLSGKAITTATDVYSLGVLLYRLLTGRLPYRLDSLTPRAVDRVLTGDEPLKPSTAVRRDPVSAPPSGEPRRHRDGGRSRREVGRPRELARRLAGDLDNIVLTALAREPGRRYGSVEQLSEDLRRHLIGLPVLARPSTFGYQMSKFLRRHKLGFAGVAAVLALVVAFALAMAWQATQVARQRDLARIERTRAEQVSRFLVDLFQEVDPMKARGGAITTPESLASGAEKVERELGDHPEVRARLLDVIGAVYLNLGLYDEAEPLLTSALATRRQRFDPRHLAVAESLDHVGALYSRQGKYEDAEPLLQQALEIRRGSLAPDHPDLGVSLRNLAANYRLRGKYDAAYTASTRSVEIFRRALGSEHHEVAHSLRVLAGIYTLRGDNRGAETLLEEALAIDEKVFGELHSATAGNLHNLGILRMWRGEYDEAEVLVGRSLAVWEQLLEEGHPRIGDALVALGRISKTRGRDAEAEERLRRGLEVYRQSLEDDHAVIANCLYELGDVVSRQGRLAEAEPILERSLAIRRGALDREHPMLGESLRGLADLRRRQGRLAAAEELYREALVVWEKHPGDESTVEIPGAYAALLRDLGRQDEARALEERADP